MRKIYGEFGSYYAQNTITYIVWECEQFGVICRQIDSIEPEGNPFFLPSAQLEIDPQTNQLIVVVEDQRYVVAGAGR